MGKIMGKLKHNYNAFPELRHDLVFHLASPLDSGKIDAIWKDKE